MHPDDCPVCDVVKAADPALPCPASWNGRFLDLLAGDPTTWGPEVVRAARDRVAAWSRTPTSERPIAIVRGRPTPAGSTDAGSWPFAEPPPVPDGRIRYGFVCPSYQRGGAERHTEELVRHLPADKFHYVGMVLTPWGEVHPESRHLAGRLGPVAAGAAGLASLAARCDVVLTWDAALHRHPRINKPVIFISHCPSGWTWVTPSIQKSIDRYDRWIAVSEDALVAIPPGRRSLARVVLNGMDPARMRPSASRAALRGKFWIPPDRKVLCFVGRMERRQKDPAILARAIEALPPEWVGLLVGGSDAVADDADSIRDEVRRIAGDRVVICGPRDDVADLMHASDVVICGSEYESYGYVIAEAWAAGVPLVTTPVGLAAGRPDLCEWIPLGASGPEAAEAVLRADSDAGRAKAAAAREFALAELTTAAMVAGYADEIRRAAADGAASSMARPASLEAILGPPPPGATAPRRWVTEDEARALMTPETIARVGRCQAVNRRVVTACCGPKETCRIAGRNRGGRWFTADCVSCVADGLAEVE